MITKHVVRLEFRTHCQLYGCVLLFSIILSHSFYPHLLDALGYTHSLAWITYPIYNIGSLLTFRRNMEPGQPRLDEGSESDKIELPHLQTAVRDSQTSKAKTCEDTDDENIIGKYGSTSEDVIVDGSGSSNEAVTETPSTSQVATPNDTLESMMNGHPKLLKSGSVSSDSAPALEAKVPFALVSGEVVSRVATTAESGKLFLTNFRLHHYSPLDPDILINVPLGLIDLAELRDPLVLTIYCKNGPLYHIPFEDIAKVGNTAEEWLKQVSEATTATEK